MVSLLFLHHGKTLVVDHLIKEDVYALIIVLRIQLNLVMLALAASQSHSQLLL
jgi:hypothetical protein